MKIDPEYVGSDLVVITGEVPIEILPGGRLQTTELRLGLREREVIEKRF